MTTTPDFMHYLQGAFNALGAGDMPAAAGLWERARQFEPEHPDVWAGLGAVAWRQGQIDDALELMRATVAKAPNVWRYSEELIRALISLGRHGEARDACAATASAQGDNADLLNYWALALQNTGDHESAMEKLRRAIAIKPDFHLLHRNLSLSLLKLGRLEESIEAFSRSTTIVEDGSGPDYDVIAVFANLVGNYDSNQLHLDMAAHMIDFAAEMVPAEVRHGARVLDCGCGTGLIGVQLPDATLKVGIDKSPEMLDRARLTGAYETLHLGDMADEMAAMGQTFDIIISNNAMFYIDDLAPFFAAAKICLAPQGYLLASFEPCTDDHDIRWVGSGNFAHSRAYLGRTAAVAGLVLATVRIQAHRAYPGFWCVFRHASANGGA